MADTEQMSPAPRETTTPVRRAAANGAATATRGRRRRNTSSDDLEAQVAQLQADIKSITHTLGRVGEDKVGEVQSLAKRRAAELKVKGEEMVSTAQDEFSALEKQFKDVIREKPLTAVASAVAVGFLLAVLTR